MTTEILDLLSDAKLAKNNGYDRMATLHLRDALRLARGNRDAVIRNAIRDTKRVLAFAE